MISRKCSVVRTKAAYHWNILFFGGADRITALAHNLLTKQQNQEENLNFPLYSLFSTMSGEINSAQYPLQKIDKNLVLLPSASPTVSAHDYAQIATEFLEELSKIPQTPAYIHSFLDILEQFTSYIPSSTEKNRLVIFPSISKAS